MEQSALLKTKDHALVLMHSQLVELLKVFLLSFTKLNNNIQSNKLLIALKLMETMDVSMEEWITLLLMLKIEVLIYLYRN